jgi:hypothetical protein
MTRLKNTNPLTLILSLSLILLSFSAFNYCAAQEVKSAPGQGGMQSPPGQPGNAAVTADKTAYKVIPIRMEMEAGAGVNMLQGKGSRRLTNIPFPVTSMKNG